MSGSERRKLVCNLVFNMISMFCVFWSIYVLIERATVEARYGMLDWPFWTKMLVSMLHHITPYNHDNASHYANCHCGIERASHTSTSILYLQLGLGIGGVSFKGLSTCVIG